MMVTFFCGGAFISAPASHQSIIAAALESRGDIEILFTDVYRCTGSNFCQTSCNRGCKYHDDGKNEKKIFSMHEK